ncbi:hypothetical protein KIN20_023295 [Parelaphostrongylus tenuis]|uniref:Uncharacterized protein n=1 Tax=Parelaphostrongylus tenuis TaxID=148309 RepID=A0AAD5MRI8_PARTN|nr:hypothetical protein KIN20_023295 [Parelaphostrongylus tenuis]
MNSADNSVRYLDKKLNGFEPQEEYEGGTSTSSCECQKISLQKMKGKCNLVNCSRITMSKPKVSIAAQDASILWEFRTTTSTKLYQLWGSALSLDHRSVQLQISNFSNDIFSVPMCVLKFSGDSTYEYMVVTNADGPCNEVALVVRNLDKFFDEKNNELVTFFKNKIATEEINDMDIVPFASDCS